MKTFAIQDDLNRVFYEHVQEVANLCDKLKEDQLSDLALESVSARTDLPNLALDLKKSNYHLFHNFCQFNDIINIQNDNFHLTPTEFKPSNLLLSVMTEFKELFECNLSLKTITPRAILQGD